MPNTSISQNTVTPVAVGHSGSAVAWSAIFAGASAAVALSLILVILGAGLGFGSLSPWMHTAPSAVKVTSVIVIWLIIMQWVSSGLGGYLAGRLRTKYVAVHTDEVFFRDTAHGFLAWAVASVIIAALSVSALSAGVRGGAQVAGAAAGAMAKPGMEKPMGPMGGPEEANMYLVDTLFRPAHPVINPANGNNAVRDDHEVRGETTRILLLGLKNGDVPPSDRDYLVSLVQARANVSQPEAARRVDDTIAQMKAAEQKAKEAADTARKTGATLSVFAFLSLLMGAFVASVAGALGGKRRDEY